MFLGNWSNFVLRCLITLKSLLANFVSIIHIFECWCQVLNWPCYFGTNFIDYVKPTQFKKLASNTIVVHTLKFEILKPT